MKAYRWTIFPSKNASTGTIRYLFKDEKTTAEDFAKDGKCLGTPMYFIGKGFLTIENAADAITVCSLLNEIENNNPTK